MKAVLFSAKRYDRQYFNEASHDYKHELSYLEAALNAETVELAKGSEALCVFVNDVLDAPILQRLSEIGIRLIALRCAGFNNVDIDAAHRYGLTVVRVPAYSPYAVAEHTIALILALNRKVHKAYNRVRDGNFALDGLLGFDLNALTVGVVGTGRIGAIVLRILNGFGCRLLACDPFRNKDCEAAAIYVGMDELLSESDIVTLHCPLTPQSHHMINTESISRMKDGVMLINTSRGGLIDAQASIAGLKSGKIAYMGLDVYEEEADLFFEDLSACVIQDDVFARLTTFPNVIITGHQAFFTREALRNIADTTLRNISDFEEGEPCLNQITLDMLKK